LQNVKQNEVIEISYVGFVTKEIVYKGQQDLSIVLEGDAQSLDEVVIVGYGKQQKKNLTGAVDQVSAEVLENRPIVNVSQGLQGVIPNLNVSVPSGAPGQSTSFNIRGAGTLNGGGQPLILVDNVQMNPDLINPNDIESITVLKDAASAAIYGARAAYGVILITTKNGRKDQPAKITISSTGFFQSPVNRVTTVNSLEYLTMKDIAYQNSGGGGRFYNPKVYEYAEHYFNDPENNSPVFYDADIDPNKYQYVGNTDWWKEIYKSSSFSQQYNIDLVGGGKKTSYYASAGFNNIDGITKAGDDEYKRVNTSLGMSTDITDKITVSVKTRFNHTEENHPNGGQSEANTSYSGLSAYSGYLKGDLSPLMPVRHPDGNYAGQGNYTNPVAVQDLGGKMDQKQNDIWLTGSIKITPFEGLTLNADYTFNYFGSNLRRHVRRFIDYTAVAGTEQPYPWTNTTSVSLNNTENYYMPFNAFAEYEKSFNNTHNFKILAGYNQEYRHDKNFYTARQDLIDNDNPSINLATGEQFTGGQETHWAINGAFMRFNYNFKQKYLVEVNGRYDGSSKFAKDDRYAFFPSVSAAYRISEEKFWKPLENFWDDMKIRGSFGSLGNQLVMDDDQLYNNFPYIPTYGINSSVNYLIGGKRPVGVYPPGLVSPSFTWEKVKQFDIGADASFFGNKLTGTFDWYKRNTEDLLTSGQPLPAVLGTGVPRENAADLSTTGFELSLGWDDTTAGGFNYWVKAVLADSQTEITRFANPEGLINTFYVGQNLGEIWGYSSQGLFQSDEEVANSPGQELVWGGEYKPGDVKYEDLDGNGIIDYGNNTLANPGDRKIIGNNTARYTYGVRTGFNYKGFDFLMFWQGVAQRDVMLGGSQFWGFTSEWDTPLEHSLDYWTEDNRDAYFPRPGWNNSGNRQSSDRYLQNAAYARLKNVTIGYTFPELIIKNSGFSKFRIYFSGENLATITDLISAYDPESLNNQVYPISRKLSLGLSISF